MDIGAAGCSPAAAQSPLPEPANDKAQRTGRRPVMLTIPETDRGGRVRCSARLGGVAAVADSFEDQPGQPLQAAEIGPFLAFELCDDEAQTVIA